MTDDRGPRFQMRQLFSALVVLIALLASPPSVDTRSSVTFTDDFGRPDGPVGNGWSDTSGNTGGDLLIRNGALSTPGPIGGGVAGVHRPITLAGPVTVSATLTPGNGFGGLLLRYGAGFMFGGDGSLSSGYGVWFHRGDQNFSDSQVFLQLNGQIVGAIPASFQFGSSLRTTVTLAPDGSISGSATQGASSFTFAFGPRSLALPGSTLTVFMGFPDSRSTVLTYPTVDDLTIDSAQQGRTFLVAFTGFGNAPPPSSECDYTSFKKSSACVIYPAGLELTSTGLVNLIANTTQLLPTVTAQAFTHYTVEDGGPYLPPSDDSIEHPEAFQWLMQQMAFIPGTDHLIIAGHSYGGNRARLFAEDLYRKHSIIPDQLVLVDPIDWTLCSISKALKPKVKNVCDQSSLSYSLVVPLPGSNAFVLRQHQPNLVDLAGYKLLGYGSLDFDASQLDASHLAIPTHTAIDDDERVQRELINRIGPNTLDDTAHRIGIDISLQRETFGTQVIVTFSNNGRIVATDFTCSVRVNSKELAGCTNAFDLLEADGLILDPGESASKTFRLPVRGSQFSGTVDVAVTANGRTTTVSRVF